MAHFTIEEPLLNVSMIKKLLIYISFFLAENFTLVNTSSLHIPGTGTPMPREIQPYSDIQ